MRGLYLSRISPPLRDTRWGRSDQLAIPLHTTLHPLRAPQTLKPCSRTPPLHTPTIKISPLVMWKLAHAPIPSFSIATLRGPETDPSFSFHASKYLYSSGPITLVRKGIIMFRIQDGMMKSSSSRDEGDFFATDGWRYFRIIHPIMTSGPQVSLRTFGTSPFYLLSNVSSDMFLDDYHPSLQRKESQFFSCLLGRMGTPSQSCEILVRFPPKILGENPVNLRLGGQVPMLVFALMPGYPIGWR